MTDITVKEQERIFAEAGLSTAKADELIDALSKGKSRVIKKIKAENDSLRREIEMLRRGYRSSLTDRIRWFTKADGEHTSREGHCAIPLGERASERDGQAPL